MKKVLRVLSKFLFILPAITLQVVWYVFLFTIFKQYSFLINIITNILTLLLVIHIVNLRGDANYKILWLIIILVFPIIGTWIYIFCGNKRSSKNITKLINHNQNYNIELPVTDKKIMHELANDNMRLSQTFNELSIKSKFPVCYVANTKYYALGEEMMSDLLNELKQAQKCIFIEYFIVEKGVFFSNIFDVLKQKAKEGVKVYFMYDDFGSLTTFSSKNRFLMEKEGINCTVFNPIITLRASINNRDHRKMVIIDNKVAFSGGINLADEYINLVVKYGHWKDIGFRVTGSTVANFTKMFIDLWNAYSPNKIKNTFQTFESDNEGYVLSYYDSPSNKEAYSNSLYVDLLSQAQKYAWIYTPYLIPSDALLEALISASKRGVDVRLYLPGIPDKKIVYRITKSYFPILMGNGVKIFLYSKGFIHAKALLIDDDITTIGTVNLDSRSLFLHFENNSLFYKNNISHSLKEDFSQIQNECEKMDLAKIKTKRFARLIDGILRLLAPLC